MTACDEGDVTVSNLPVCRIVVSIVNIVDTIKLELAPEKSEKPTEKSPNREKTDFKWSRSKQI